MQFTTVGDCAHGDMLMSCPNLEIIERYASGGLDQPERCGIEAHFQTCDACRGRLAEVQDNMRAAEQIARARAEAEVPGGTQTIEDLTLPPARPQLELAGYEIVRELHRGGQGVVYQAIQKSTKRKVAVKVLLEGPFASPSSKKRFEREIDLVAQLKHPNIITIFDSGTTSDGRLFFAMDYVRGLPLHQYVRDNKLTLEQTLKLFGQVCAAVQYAHQKGVIHRDLKPSNVLVDHEGVPRVLDFGLAKQMAAPIETIMSMTGQVIGTLPYMSPEQARGNPDEIDTRTDVYALGVILYELLTGHYPYPVVGELEEVLRNIRETPPTPPSRAWRPDSGIAVRSARKPRPARCPIDDEIETISLKCLAKERERRYNSAGELAKDVAHYLAGEPIEAKRDSVGYVLRKHLRRYRVQAALAASFVMIITGGLIVALALWQRAAHAEREQTRERQRAERALANEADQRGIAEREAERAGRAEVDAKLRADELEQVARFQASQLSGIDAQAMGATLRLKILEARREVLARRGLDSSAIEAALRELESGLSGVNFTNIGLDTLDAHVFERALQAIEKEFAAQPILRAHLLETLAHTLRRLGLLDEASGPALEALGILRRMLGNDHSETLSLIAEVGDLLQEQGKLAEAESFLREALAISRKVLGDTHTNTLKCMLALGTLFEEQGKLADAESYVREALAASRRVFGDADERTLAATINLGWLLERRGKLDEAELYSREALAGARRELGDDHPKTLTAINNLGLLLQRRGKLNEAEGYLRAALENNRRVLGDDHPDTLTSINNIGGLLQSQGKLPEAEPYLREGLAGHRRVLGDDHPDTLSSINNLGGLLRAEGKLAEAELYLPEALQKSRRVLGDDHPKTLSIIGNMGHLRWQQGVLKEAESYLRERLDGMRRLLGDHDPELLRAVNDVAMLLRAEDKLSDAELLFTQSLEAFRKLHPEPHPYVALLLHHLAAVLRVEGRVAEAAPVAREAVQMYRAHPAWPSDEAFHASVILADVLNDAGEAQEFVQEILADIARIRATQPPGDARLAMTLAQKGLLLLRAGAYLEAEPVLRDCLEMRRALYPDGHPQVWLRFNTMSLLGAALTGQGLAAAKSQGSDAAIARFGEAESLLLDGYDGIRDDTRVPPGVDGADRKHEALERIVKLYEAWHAAEPDKGYDAKAAEWRAKLDAAKATTQPAGEPATLTQPASSPSP